MPKKPDPSKKSDLVGFRSAAIAAQLNEIVAANPGRITKSELIRAAVEEKLQRLRDGEGIKLVFTAPQVAPVTSVKRAKRARPVEVKPKTPPRMAGGSADMAGA